MTPVEPDASPAVSVIVPVYNEAAHIRDAVGAMRAQTVTGGFELLLVDGRSTDGTREIIAELAREDPRVIALDNPDRNIPSALNIGLAAARADHVARMDAHSYYPPDYLESGVERLALGDVAWVAGPQIPVGRDPGSRRVELALRSRLGMGGASFRRELTEEIETDAGFTGVWRRETLESFGGWDEQWLINEDGELAARIRASGGRIVCVPAMAADYSPRGTLRALARQYWRYGQYRAKTSGRHPRSMRRSHVVPPAVVVCWIGALAPGLVGRLMRFVVTVYLVAIAGAGARAGGAGALVRDAAGVPPALATMHLAWGSGFIVGSVRFGPPLRAIARLMPGSRGHR